MAASNLRMQAIVVLFFHVPVKVDRMNHQLRYSSVFYLYISVDHEQAEHDHKMNKVDFDPGMI